LDVVHDLDEVVGIAVPRRRDVLGVLPVGLHVRVRGQADVHLRFVHGEQVTAEGGADDGALTLEVGPVHPQAVPPDDDPLGPALVAVAVPVVGVVHQPDELAGGDLVAGGGGGALQDGRG